MALVTRVFLDAARDGNLMPFLAFACAHACGVLQCPRVHWKASQNAAHVDTEALRTHEHTRTQQKGMRLPSRAASRNMLVTSAMVDAIGTL